VAVGGQSDGKSSLLEALLGFRFNLREVEMGTRRPLVLQMVHDPTAHNPRCRFKVKVPVLPLLIPPLFLYQIEVNQLTDVGCACACVAGGGGGVWEPTGGGHGNR
jgi:hypothetical protein